MNIDLWVEKYRPKKLDEIINQEHVVSRLKHFVKNKNIPHMLFSGPAGCGKTTAALCVVRELFGDKWRQNYLELNASDERGINTIRGKVKDFARTRTIGDLYKIIILDEADALTGEAQQALRRMMEKYTNTCRFILICNYSSRIIEPIQSRCVVFRFKTLERGELINYLKLIAKREKLNVKDTAYEAIVDLSFGDLRKAITILQACSLEREINEKTVYEISAKAEPKKIKEMLKFAFDGNFGKAREILLDILFKDGVSGEDIIKGILNQVNGMEIPDREKVKLIEKIGEYEFRINQGGDPHIQLEALLAQFIKK